ncbi:ABC transporter [Candidatus Izimaplasma bacterium ZiA1]|uniref:ABC transporter ATP-binding protein n=1 Tax=Candidatus Izimoplasma sp. ZiA1 TaxID=2024899 RepID=UPI000BAA6137|nr:ABC transporter [Candidatus Izimaplasma bacterium ZiA1]
MYVKLNNINFEYVKNNLILDDFSLEIKKGDIAALIGNSGSGKSTILRILSGLETPISGEVIVNDQILFNTKISINPEKRNVGMVFQDYALFPHLSVKKNIYFGLHGKTKDEKDKIVNDVLELVNLKHKINNYPYELSGGEQQRIALARSLATNPDVLLLDEPFSNLDANLKKQIRKELKQIIKKADITCIFVTHDIEDANDIADEIINLKKTS